MSFAAAFLFMSGQAIAVDSVGTFFSCAILATSDSESNKGNSNLRVFLGSEAMSFFWLLIDLFDRIGF